MPPRYAYWTILVDDQPTAFRAGAQEDLMPTFKRLKEKHPSAKMMWFQNGKLWPSRLDAQEAMRARGEMGRRRDARQSGAGGFRDRKPAFRDRQRERNVGETFRSPARERKPGEKLEWNPRSESPDPKPQAPSPKSPEKLEWKPKGEFTPAPKRERSDRPEWKPRGEGERFSGPPAYAKAPAGKRDFKTSRPRPQGKPEWKPKGSFDRGRKPEWKPGSSRPRSEGKLEWKPRGEGDAASPKPQAPGPRRQWIAKEEYKKSKGIEAPRDSKWRPGGEHRDPKQKYKDAKKAKWTRFKKQIRSRWEGKKKPE